ncbi:pilus assembly FimT family protein [Gallaecimonas mangrovi]|uniref:pilus assembly FimT family protein n=1 Tax=Gallaecimonas mangrovi TaxID=2291597 RepID=UPI000E20889A|nr:prepilin-type N-terminal cleavage/methylation domain-containing protein [Gallaecimonas mangrovi]
MRDALREPGFTLLELLITIAVVSILASIAVPSFQSVVKERQLAQAAESIRNQILLGKSEAVRLNQDLHFFVSNYSTSSQASWCVGVTSESVSDGDECNCAFFLDPAISSGKCDLAGSGAARALQANDLKGVKVYTSPSDHLFTLNARNKGSEAGNLCVVREDDPSEGRCVTLSSFGKVSIVDNIGSCSSCP